MTDACKALTQRPPIWSFRHSDGTFAESTTFYSISCQFWTLCIKIVSYDRPYVGGFVLLVIRQGVWDLSPKHCQPSEKHVVWGAATESKCFDKAAATLWNNHLVNNTKCKKVEYFKKKVQTNVYFLSFTLIACPICIFESTSFQWLEMYTVSS